MVDFTLSVLERKREMERGRDGESDEEGKEMGGRKDKSQRACANVF